MSEGEICASQRRASSEGLGLLARLGNDIFTARMVYLMLMLLYMLLLEAIIYILKFIYVENIENFLLLMFDLLSSNHSSTKFIF